MDDFKNTTDIDLRKLLIEKENALKNFRFNIAGSKTRNVKEGKVLRKSIAQILTEMSSRGNK